MQFRSKVLYVIVGVIIGIIVGYSVSHIITTTITANIISDLEDRLKAEKEKSLELVSEIAGLEKKLSEAMRIADFLNKTKLELQREVQILREELENKSIELANTKMKLQLAENESKLLRKEILALKEEIYEIRGELENFKGLVANAGLNQIRLSKIFFYFTEPPEGEINPNAIYKRGQDVWIFAELRGFGVKIINQTYVAHIIWRLDIYDVYGNLIVSIPVDKYEEMIEKPESAWLKACFSANLSPGVYIAVLTAYDKISLKFTARAGAFLIEE